jgi:hypothetical protein
VPVGTTTLIIGAHNRGRTLATQFHEPLPTGHLVSFGHGRVWVMKENVLYWSETLRYAQGDRAKNYLRFPKRGALLACVGDGTEGAGVFVGAGKRISWLGGGAGNPNEFRQVIAYSAPAVPGSLAWAPADLWGFESKLQVPCWLAGDGQFCVGLPGGQVKTFNDARVAAQAGESGASFIREENGMRSMITAVRGPAMGGLAMRERMVATVRRHTDA